MARRRSTVARHAHLRSPHPLGQLLTIVAVAVAVVLVAGVGVAAFSTFQLTSKLVAKAVDLPDAPAIPPDIGGIEGGFNLVLTGIDTCEPKYAALFGARCQGPDASDHLNDVTMLVHISSNPRRITVVSFPRDLLIQLPQCRNANGQLVGGGFGQFNTAYTYGGLACVVAEVEKLSGQNVQGAAMVTFGGVIQITDAIGGVNVCLATGIRDRYTGLDMAAGTHTISGLQALQFLRTRHGVHDGSDLGRISNQQQYMSSLARKIVSENLLADPALLYKLATVTLDNVTPTKSLTNPLTLVQLALAVKGVPFDDITFVQYPTVAAPSDRNRVAPNESAAAVLWDAIASNKQLKITGAVGANGSQVEVTPAPTTPAPGATPTPGATSTPSPTTPPDQVAVLPPSITGSNPSQQTCTVGDLKH
ncbi:MAG: LCP family protein [Microbacterium sp.]|nr:LCP family protein [Microbacterium sp.]